MPAVIEAHEPELVSQGALILLGPDEVALTEAMDQQHGFAVGLAVFVAAQKHNGVCSITSHVLSSDSVRI